MARDPHDLAALTSVLVDSDKSKLGSTTNSKSKAGERNLWTGLRIGVVDTKWGVHEKISRGKWDSPDVVRVYKTFMNESNLTPIQKAAYQEAVDTMESLGARMVYPFQIPEADMLRHEGHALRDVSCESFQTLGVCMYMLLRVP